MPNHAPDPVTAATAPEEQTVDSPPPTPDYPRYRVEPGIPIRLSDVSPDESEGYASKSDVKSELAHHRERIADLQERLYAEQRQSLLVVLQAMDTGGKDGAIKHVFKGINPQGCRVWSFKAPSSEEAAHDFLWRYHLRTPSRGMITIFNRSHYEDVLVVRVKKLVPEELWRDRYETLCDFERTLARENVVILKFYLHISKDEQKRRLEARLQDPAKHWKFSSNDLKERANWDDYQRAFEDAVNATSTAFAPWYVVPANKKWYRNLVIARTIADTLAAMGPEFPAPEKGLDKIVVPD
ncbi:MAG TPA: polyphosphate kinase 2 family protein [Solirubrobacteraceae bacterium]|nr:polyphosphate kinase 2 family protein [Solirubrobacteraceae bacterium]